MGRLIDADEVNKAIYKSFEDVQCYDGTGYDIYSDIKEIIDKALPVEAIPKSDYENRLKADMVAMLTEIQSEVLKLKSYESADGQDLAMLADIGILFQQKINKIKENQDGKISN